MADKLPLVIDAGVVEQLQSGDILVNQEGTVVYAGAAFATDNTVLRADGTGFGSQTSPLTISDLGQLFFGQTPPNVILGYNQTGGSLTTGQDNMLMGGFCGPAITTGIRNMLIGGSTGSNLVIGNRNTGIGFASLFFSDSLVVGETDDNVAIGDHAGFNITIGSDNTFIGSGAGWNASQKVDAVNSMALGSLAFTTADNQVVIGNTAITENIFHGKIQTTQTSTMEDSGTHLPVLEVLDSTAAIYFEITAFTNASSNFGFGRGAGANITTATLCTLIGTLAGANITEGSSNTLIGEQTGTSITGGAGNLGLGNRALLDCTTGGTNVAVGRSSLRDVVQGDGNTAVGVNAGGIMESGDENIFIGKNAGNTGQVITVNNTICIGVGVVSSNDDEIIIGNISNSDTRLRGITEHIADPLVQDQLWDDEGIVRVSDGIVRDRGGFTRGAGTAHQLTATPAAVVMGTTSPVIVTGRPATYRVLAHVVVNYNAATFAANQAVTFKIRRTNNTAADLAGGTTVYTTEIITTLSHTMANIYWEADDYTTANTDDSLTIFGDVAVVPSAGTLDVVEAFIRVIRMVTL